MGASPETPTVPVDTQTHNHQTTNRRIQKIATAVTPSLTYAQMARGTMQHVQPPQERPTPPQPTHTTNIQKNTGTPSQHNTEKPPTLQPPANWIENLKTEIAALNATQLNQIATQIHTPSSTINKILEYTIIKRKTENNNTLFIISAYATNDNRTLYITELEHLFQTLNLHDANNYYIIAGDLNTKRKDWGDITNNQRGRYFKKWENKHDLTYRLHTITTSTPTFKPGLSFLDICLADSRLHLTNSTTGKASTLPYDSDHLAVSMSFELPSNIPTANYPETIKLNYKATKWKAFTKEIDRNYTNTIPTDCNLTITDIDNNLLTITDTEFTKAINKYWTTVIKQIDHRNNDTFFPKINSIFRRKPPSTIDDIHIKQSDSHILDKGKCNTTTLQKTNDSYILTTPTDKLNAIGAYYETVNSPRYLNDGTRLKEIIDNTARTLTHEFATNRHNMSTITQFSNLNNAKDPEDTDDVTFTVNSILKRLPNKTSVGTDRIPPIVLKHLPDKIITHLAILFNNAINNSYFPKIWKTAKVLPILKRNKNPNDPSSYRPISLTPSLSKVYEAVIYNKITQHCTSHNIIPDCQFGFRHKHSTTHAIHKFISDVNNKISNNQLVGAALLDLEKAFDSVWLNGPLYKLHRKEFPKWLIHTILDMTTDKKFVTWDGKTTSSQTFHITEGLQQGTVNSPILFNIYTSDLLKAFEFNKPNKAAVLAFADDLVTYTSSNRVNTVQTELETTVNKINNY
ncbi:uncharacterized protein LOC143363129 [Halictus rubicundus]|uniref:uncharacterized protein LOC143363129 n=1 Tax=Halictus rubicundus TaxID=77578 RepID=UPI0040357842